MKKKHYALLVVCILIIGLLATYYLYRTPNILGEENTITETIKEIVTIEPKMLVLHEDDTYNGSAMFHYDIRILSEEEQVACGEEITRLYRVRNALYAKYRHIYLLRKYHGWTEEERIEKLDELTALDRFSGKDWEIKDLQELANAWTNAERFAPVNTDEPIVDPWEREDLQELVHVGTMLYSLAEERHNPMVAKLNDDLHIVWDQVMDVRNGEIRFPPTTREYWALHNKLFDMMKKPDPSDEDIEQIKRLAMEINKMVRENTPTSVYQMPE